MFAPPRSRSPSPVTSIRAPATAAHTTATTTTSRRGSLSAPSPSPSPSPSPATTAAATGTSSRRGSLVAPSATSHSTKPVSTSSLQTTGASGEFAYILCQCPEGVRRLLVSRVCALLEQLGSTGLAGHTMQEYMDAEAGTFHLRLALVLVDEAVRPLLNDAFARLRESLPPKTTTTLRHSNPTARVAVFVSNAKHCLYDLLVAWKSGDLPCDVAVVVSNHDTLRPVAEQFGVPFECVDPEHVRGPRAPTTDDGDGLGRRDRETHFRRILTDYRIDLVVLARFMQVFSPELLQWLAAQPGSAAAAAADAAAATTAHTATTVASSASHAHHRQPSAAVPANPYRVINIHHSLLPAFAGAQAYRQAYERGVKVMGATAHYATALLDDGPIIEQDTVRVSHAQSANDLRLAGRAVEKAVLVRAVQAHLTCRVVVVEVNSGLESKSALAHQRLRTIVFPEF
eukprot:gnl/Spiro4/1925_TR909_c1_g1_i1.p1 gnl/Spiro4/1925_TR909_c1_g1~~gnl/Spiro4/1925_TR909_c1_g1_i1.p1  ORF type:complete len:480 (+),score=152.70 gnl/Spiro4/1925_TR909_c1_g1_i1:75-1442(+)